MKELLISNSERNCLLKCLEDYTRLDGRSFDEFRKFKIDFGKDWGCCHVSLGSTRVLAQVSCEIQQPKSSRPNEGLININVELSPMAAPQFESGRPSELSVHLNRLLEKCLKDSKAVDLESFCIKLYEKVWALRIDINVLNNEGNILDCASVAALTAIAHFRRPDVTSEGETTIVHSYRERDPIPSVIHHYPVCITYAVFNSCSTIVADPSLLEEGVSDAQLVFAINSFKEICSIHLGGSTFANTQLVLQCASKAAARAFNVVEQIKKAIEVDLESRLQHKNIFFQHSLIKDMKEDDSIISEQLAAIVNKWSIKQSKKKSKKKKVENETNDEMETGEVTETNNAVEKTVVPLGENSAAIVNENEQINLVSSSEESDLEIIELPPPPKIVIDSDSNSEEEKIVTLTSEMNAGKKKSGKRKKTTLVV